MRKAPWTTEEHLARGMAKAIEVGECLEWQGSFSCGGVTPILKVRFPGAKRSENVPVCRELWVKANGPIPPGMLVYRKCCNNLCVCPEHLKAGTRAQWHEHRKKNGKTKHKLATKLKMTAAARKRPNVVNSLEKAREVRALKGTMLKKDIAAMTGVSAAMVSDICSGQAWKDTIANPFAGLMA